MAGLADTRGHLTKTYQYTVTGELAYGSAAYENEYTYNGESYNPNIHSQYLRARYYSVVTASFLTEDSYLGNIREPLTLNRYNYCVSSYLNYVDPSGNRLIPQDARDEIQKLVGRDYYIPRIQGVRDKILDALGLNGFHLEMLPSMREGKTIPPMWTPTYGVERDGNGAWMDGGIGAFLNNIKCEHDAEYYLQIATERAEENRRNEECGKEQRIGNFVGYLSYGAKGIVENSLRGYYRLYDAPTVSTEGDQYFFEDIYKENNVKAVGALQSYCGSASRLNYNGGSNYGGQTLDYIEGMLFYNGIERHAIAVGPKLQDPQYDYGNIDAKKMAYGTCADISIVLDSVTYYIPAIIVDVKANSAPTGIIQTGWAFDGKYEDTGTAGPIIEWYVIQKNENGNKSAGLDSFSTNGSIIIYREEVLE